MRTKSMLVLLALSFLLVLTVAGCAEKAEEAGSLQQAAEDAGQAVQDAAEQAGEAVEGAAEEAGQAMEEAAEAVEEATKPE